MFWACYQVTGVLCTSTTRPRQCMSTVEEDVRRGTAAAIPSLPVCCAKHFQPSLIDDDITLQPKNKTFT